MISANEARRKRALADRIQAAVGGNLQGRKIALSSASPSRRDRRHPRRGALTVIPELQRRGAMVAAFDPVAMDNGRNAFESVQWCADAYFATIGADAVVVL